MALKDILSNAKYPDDMVLNLPDGSTVNVGEIRSLPVAERAALTSQIEQRANTLGQAELAFAAKFQDAVKAGWMAQDGRIVPPAAPTRTAPDPAATLSAADLRRAAAAEYGLDESDPLLGPVVKEMKTQLAQRDATLAALQSKIDALPSQFDSLKSTFTDGLSRVTGVVNTSVGRYLNDTYQQQFAQATKDLPKGVTVGYEDAFKYATEKGLKDKDGFLQLDAAVDRLTWDARKKAELASERADLIAKTTRDLEEKRQVATLTPPSRGNALAAQPVKDGDFNPFNERIDAKGNKVKSVKSFEEAMAAASMDEDILKTAMGTASFGMVQ